MFKKEAEAINYYRKQIADLKEEIAILHESSRIKAEEMKYKVTIIQKQREELLKLGKEVTNAKEILQEILNLDVFKKAKEFVKE